MKYRLVQVSESFYEIQEKPWFWPWWIVSEYHVSLGDATARLQRLRNPYKPKVLDL